MTSDHRSTSGRIRRVDAARRLPDSFAACARQAAGLSRQCGDDAEASAGAGGDRALLQRGQRQRASRRPHAERARHGCVRGGARQGREVHRRRPTPRRSSLRATPPRASTSWRRPGVGPTCGRATRSSSPRIEHHSNIVPWQLLCDETRRVAARGADLRQRRARSRRLPSECSERGRIRLVAMTALSNALGTVTPIAEIIRLAHDAGALVLVDGAQAAYHMAIDVTGARLRLLRPDRPQALRTDRHRRALRQVGAARGDAAVAGRRRHDQLGHLREIDVERAAVQVRGRHAAHRRGGRPGRGASTTSARSACRGSRPTNASCWRTAPSRCARFPACSWSVRRRRRPASCRS